MAERSDERFLRLALRLARRGCGRTSPNPMVGAVLVKAGKIIGRGWHRGAGRPHAEIEALRDAARRGSSPRGATLFVTLEPCCTHGRTPPCTDALIAAQIKRVVIGAIDPNPRHAGRGIRLLRRAGIDARRPAVPRSLAEDCVRLNEPFNHWIARRTPFVTVKAAMTLDGKIATASGESKWITGEPARAFGMNLRRGADAVLVGINTVLADDPALTLRGAGTDVHPGLRRIVLDSLGQTPLNAQVVSDPYASLTTIVVSRTAPKRRIAALEERVRVIVAPAAESKIKNQKPKIALPWLLKKLGAENVTHLLVEGGGEVNASFLVGGFAQRIAFFYAPKVFGGRDARKAVAGDGAQRLAEALELEDIETRPVGADLFVTARVSPRRTATDGRRLAKAGSTG